MLGEYRGHEERITEIDRRYKRHTLRFIVVLVLVVTLSVASESLIDQARARSSHNVIEMCRLYLEGE